ncbi:MAG: hypothetical protein ACI8ZM_005408, partial [Crocinitomix sp.]
VGPVLMLSCGKITPYENDTNNSTFTEDESHYDGENCMNCHYSAGEGDGWFSLAGTARGNTENALVELYNDTLQASVKKIQVDTRGNFYTTDQIDFSNGYFVGTRNSAGDVQFMNTPIQVGQCNLCHGATTAALTIN